MVIIKTITNKTNTIKITKIFSKIVKIKGQNNQKFQKISYLRIHLKMMIINKIDNKIDKIDKINKTDKIDNKK